MLELWRYDALRKRLEGEQEKSKKKELGENEHGVVMEEEEKLNL